jgi:hypothetical protein
LPKITGSFFLNRYYGFRTPADKAKSKGKSKLEDKVVPAIIVTFLQFTYCISIFFLKRHIELAMLLIQEAMNTIKNVPTLLLLPWLVKWMPKRKNIPEKYKSK